MNLRTMIIVGTLFAASAGLPARAQQQLRFEYVETLRGEASFRGEAFRPDSRPATPAEAVATLRRPAAVAADAFRVYVTDRYIEPSQGSLARIFILDRGTRTATIIRSDPSVTAAVLETRAVLLDPAGIAADMNGTVYVADARQGLVFGLDRLGNRLLTVGRPGDLSAPVAVAVDEPRRRLYVADRHAGVRVFTVQGGRLFDIGGPEAKKGRLRTPVGIALDRAGTCYVLEERGRRVKVYDLNGRHLRSLRLDIGPMGIGLKPGGIAVDSEGHIYVTDSFNNAIHVFSPDGSHLQSLGRMGSGRDEFWSPQGIFIDGRDTIYIADEMNGRVQVYQYVK
jgi:DNA-binding beta-propeller fold protein YncE